MSDLQHMSASHTPLPASTASGSAEAAAAVPARGAALVPESTRSGYNATSFNATPGSARSGYNATSFNVSSSIPPYIAAGTDEDLTHILISHQTFEGSWDISSNILGPLNVSAVMIKAEAKKAGVEEKMLVTALVVAVFEEKLREFEGSWELVVEKARGWLGEQVQNVDALVGQAGKLVQ